MPVEAPIQVDLSQENSWDSVSDEKLTVDEKALLRDHFKEESDAIIYLTEGELQKLKDIISINDIPAQEDFREFIIEQSNEGLSTADLLGGDFEGIEAFSEIDELSHEGLFGEEGVFTALDISPVAQDTMSVALSLSIIEHISEGDISSQEDIITQMSTLMQEKLGELKSLSEKRMVLGQTSTIPQLDISGAGEKNSIFMNPEEGKDFFLKIFLGDLDERGMESTLEGANTDDIPEWNLQELSLNTTVDIQEIALKVLGNRETAGDVNTTGVVDIDPNNPSTLEIKEDDNWFIRLIKQLFSGILEVGETFGMNNNPDETDTAVTEVAEDLAPTRVDTLRTSMLGKLSEGSFLDIQDASIQEYLEGEGNMESFITIMQDIPTYNGQDTLEEKIENLLFSNIESEDTNKFVAFIDAGSLESIKNTDGTLNVQNFLLAATSYKNYRVAHIADTTLTYEEFFANSNE